MASGGYGVAARNDPARAVPGPGVCIGGPRRELEVRQGTRVRPVD
jgi:hypothetical protein